MIFTVTVNPCLDEDKFFEQDDLLEGTNRAVESEKYPGGKGIDVSRAIHAAGSRSVATGFIGGHIGKLVQGLLAIEDVDCDFVEIGTETRTNVICHLNKGKEVRINSSGPKVSGVEYHELLEKARRFEKVDAGVVCGSVCEGMETINSYNQILSAFKQCNERCLTFLDTGETHTMAALDAKWPPDFIKPNIYEFHRLLKVKVKAEGIAPPEVPSGQVDEQGLIKRYCTPHKDLPAAWSILVSRLSEFAASFPEVKVLLSVSKFGVLTLLDRNTVAHAFYCKSLVPTTTVGAGDSFLGGFIASYVDRYPRDMPKALRAGVATSVARLQGQHRQYGYIDQEILQEVSTSEKLQYEKFEVDKTAEYVTNTLLTHFPSEATTASPKSESKGTTP